MEKISLSICIPTYNRANNLINCLESLYANEKKYLDQITVCISDNCSTDNTKKVVSKYLDKLPIIYSKNKTNLGIPKNFLKVVSMSNAEYVWLVGDDDLFLENSIERVLNLISKNKDIDFFYVNSYHLDTEYVDSFSQPFDVKNIPKNMEKFSKWNFNGKIKFFDLIRPEVSFDFLGGMFLSVFRKSNWDDFRDVLDEKAIESKDTFSHFDNTFPHVKIFASAFSNSIAYFNSNPMNICLTGAREWAPMEPLVRNIRLIEALDAYKKNGLPTLQYFLCRNFALSNFIPGFIYMLLNKEISGYRYIENPLKKIIFNMVYPNFYLSVLRFIIRKLRLRLNKIFNKEELR
tara:strand:- start:645 stop:1685 length:1041 start_codon:yes stop_codon:yes gene_type:complete